MEEYFNDIFMGVTFLAGVLVGWFLDYVRCELLKQQIEVLNEEIDQLKDENVR